MSILNVPVQINRGTSVPKLKEGEPFFNLSNNYLYIGGTKISDINISGQSARTLRIVNNNGLFDLSATESTASIGGFHSHFGLYKAELNSPFRPHLLIEMVARWGEWK